jgi:hypothetical protein
MHQNRILLFLCMCHLPLQQMLRCACNYFNHSYTRTLTIIYVMLAMISLENAHTLTMFHVMLQHKHAWYER